MSATQEKKIKEVVGVVVANKSDKTIKVLIENRFKNRLYSKYITRSTKLMAHDEHNECELGDTVLIVSSRPISKRKSWRLVKCLKKAES